MCAVQKASMQRHAAADPDWYAARMVTTVQKRRTRTARRERENAIRHAEAAATSRALVCWLVKAGLRRGEIAMLAGIDRTTVARAMQGRVTRETIVRRLTALAHVASNVPTCQNRRRGTPHPFMDVLAERMRSP